MLQLTKIYIDGAFVAPHGTEVFDLVSPVTNQKTGEVVLGDAEDVRLAVAAAKKAFKTFSLTTIEERIHWLQRLQEVVSRRQQELTDAMVEEYGASYAFCKNSVLYSLTAFSGMIALLKEFDFTPTVGRSKVRLESIGVAGIITPWNASNSFICNKVATAIAAGCTTVVKPSEMSARQTQLIMECFHEAGLPKGVVNIINGLGDVVGAAITAHPDIAKISFTGSTAVGKAIARGAADSLKRVTLELGGKSPNIILDDADLATSIPAAVLGAYMNNGQACIAPTRLLVPAEKLEEVNALAAAAVQHVRVGNPKDEATTLGPLVNSKQFKRVQEYIRLGLSEGATLLAGGEGKPEGLEAGNFVRPTIFTNVRNDMRIAQEEIFGPVLSIIPYKDEADAIAIANDTTYGLAAYISSADVDRARRVAAKIEAGRICINGFSHDPGAPFGGFKQSGIGREYGVYGLEEYLEPKAILE